MQLVNGFTSSGSKILITSQNSSPYLMQQAFQSLELWMTANGVLEAGSIYLKTIFNSSCGTVLAATPLKTFAGGFFADVKSISAFGTASSGSVSLRKFSMNTGREDELRLDCPENPVPSN